MGGAYELKFLLPREQATETWSDAESVLSRDPHAIDPSPEDSGQLGYWVESVYLDTADLSVYHRHDGFSRCKYRIRRYGAAERVFLERKRKRRGLVRKRRTEVEVTELANLKTGAATDIGWAGEWFRQRMERRCLMPRARVRYFRRALLGTSTHGGIRMTLDTHLSCLSCPSDGWFSGAGRSSTHELFPRQAILEFKFCEAMPAPFREWIESLGGSLGKGVTDRCSKYRRSIDALCGRASHSERSFLSSELTSWNSVEGVRDA